MARTLDQATREALLARVRFYRDLGLTEFYRRPVDPALLAQWEAAADEPQDSRAPSFPRPFAERVGEPPASPPQPATDQYPSFQEDPAIRPRKLITAPPQAATAAPAADRAAALEIIREEIGDCTRCALHKGRNKLVFGDGTPRRG